MCDTGKVDMKNVHSFIFGIDKNKYITSEVSQAY